LFIQFFKHHVGGRIKHPLPGSSAGQEPLRPQAADSSPNNTFISTFSPFLNRILFKGSLISTMYPSAAIFPWLNHTQSGAPFSSPAGY